jgi:hypothetical protein
VFGFPARKSLNLGDNRYAPRKCLTRTFLCGAMDVESQKTLKTRKIRIISTVLSPAVQLWLRSQVERVEALQFKLIGGDRQIVTGNIPGISIAATSAVYQGLHLSKIQLEGRNIRVNLGQVIKGKPLCLLEPVPVVGQLLLSESDFQASLQSPLLSTALTEFLASLLALDEITNSDDHSKYRKISFSWQQIAIDMGQLTLKGTLIDGNLQTTPVVIRAGLQLASPHELLLNPFQIQMSSAFPSRNLDGFQVDLGSDVELQELTLTPGQLMCRGRLTVLP